MTLDAWYSCAILWGVPNRRSLVMPRRPLSRMVRLSQVERDENAGVVARNAAESALCQLGYRNGIRWDDDRFEAEAALLTDVLLVHLNRVTVRTLIGSRVPCPDEAREEVSRVGAVA